MADGNIVEILPKLPAKGDALGVAVPGRLRWFEKGSPDYQNWVSEQKKFITKIEMDSQEGEEIFNDIVDGILESEVPSGILSAILAALKITKTAQLKRKRRQIWRKVVNYILRWTFSDPTDQDSEFVFDFSQVRHLWRAAGGETLSPQDYKKVYSTIYTKLHAGRLKEEIMKFPVLNRYIGYKLRQFKYSFQQYQIGLIEE